MTTFGKFSAATLAFAMLLAAGVQLTYSQQRKKPGSDASTSAPSTQVKPSASWEGPGEFELKNGKVVGDWWQGGAMGVVYYTGKHASKIKSMEKIGIELAGGMKMTYQEIHADDLKSTEQDTNGPLLYPDGTARIRLFLMPGGVATLTTMELAGIASVDDLTKDQKGSQEKFAECRKNPQQAVKTGMNYVGVCAGAFAAASGFDIPQTMVTSWCLWPGKIANLGPSKREPFPDLVFLSTVDKSHPLLKSVGAGGKLAKLYFNGGPLNFQKEIPDTEYFATYTGGALTELEGMTGLISYLPADNPQSGRVVLCSGHPEVSHVDFYKAMCLYALAHKYSVPENRIDPAAPVNGVSGDRQMQYYCLKVEEGKTLEVKLTEMDGNCDLYVSRELPPTFKKADAKSCLAAKADEVVAIKKAKAGDYYIGVYGNHDVLNGVKYKLQVSVGDN